MAKKKGERKKDEWAEMERGGEKRREKWRRGIESEPPRP